MAHKILIVDDEPNIVISLEFLMKKEGFEIAVATDGEEALAKVASFGPDLMLLDVMMPKKSGFDAYVTKPFSTKELVAKVKSMLGVA